MYDNSLRSRKAIVVVTAVILLVVVGGCCDTRAGARLKWEKMADGDGVGEEFWNKFTSYAYEGGEPRLIVVTDLAAVSMLQGRVSATHLTLIADVDFSSYWVAVIHRGKEIVTTYEPIEVSSVRLRDNVVTIQSHLRRATFEPAYHLTTVSPYYILKIRKPMEVEEKEIAFALEDDGHVISQICAIEGERLSWEKMMFDRGGYGGASYDGSSPQLVVIAQQADVSSVQNQLLSEHLSLIADVGFSKYFVAIIYQGLKGETGYPIEVIDVKQEGDRIILCSQLHEPIPHQACGQVMTSPYYILRIERPKGSGDAFTFVLLDGGEEIARQVENVP